jgi:hypothetical protein
MSGMLHYLLAVIDPMTNLGFARAFGELMSSLDPAWWLLFVTMFVLGLLPSLAIWIIHLVNPAKVHPPLPDRPIQAEPLVSVVIAGRNESATIGQVIRGALLCGYRNLEVIFVDDNSNDNSIAAPQRQGKFAEHRDPDGTRGFHRGNRCGFGHPIRQHSTLAAAVRRSARRRCVG